MGIDSIGKSNMVVAQADISRGGAKSQKGTPQVIELGEMVIEGRIQKPEAFYILQRSTLNYKVMEPKETFIKKILDSVKKDLF